MAFYGIWDSDKQSIRATASPVIGYGIKGENKEELLSLYRKLVNHLRKSPVFYPGEEFTDEVYMEYVLDPDTILFAAFDNGRIIGILDANREGNSFITNEEDVYNVGDIYLEKEYRGQGIAQGLLQFAGERCKELGAKKLWVEHGTANPNARGFWDKYFKSYSYTLTREIDERMVRGRNMKLKSGELTEEQAIEISKWQYTGEYEIYNLPDWDTMVKEGYSMCDEIKRKRFTSYVDENGNVMGFTNILDEGSNIFFGIGVNPRYCGQGIGKEIIKSSLNECKIKYPNKPIILEVRTWNKRAVNCYKSQGFKIIETKRQSTHLGEGEFYVMKYINN